ncbi:PREDICTED: pentatricopeptide repeat-containing protein DOT4, chloroplastic-like [Nelumbo nucifera]|nr:PREDICTED: pentatricopeptide repeat-containing protein DOT4, chloroplastic-like [Nelumbo nucifera]
MEMFSHVRLHGLTPNSFTMVAILVTLKGLLDPMLGHSIHGLIIKTGLASNLTVGTAMLDAFAKCGNIVDSYKLFEQIREPSLVTYTAMISGFIHNELFEEAFMLFNQLRPSNVLPNSVTMLSVIRGCIALESRGLSESVHAFVLKTGFCSYLAVINAILDMYSNLEDLQAATKVFNNMTSMDVISWTTMVGLLVHLDLASEALKLFCRMRDSGFSPDTVVLVNLTRACALLGDLNTGKAIHALAVIHGYGLDLHLLNSILAMYSKFGCLDSSKVVFDRMAEKSLVTWTAMISGYLQNGWPKEGLNLLIQVRRLSFHIDSVVLVNSLAACGQLASSDLCKQLHCYILVVGFARYKSVQNSLVSAYSKCGDIESAQSVFKEIISPDVVSWNVIISGYGINSEGETAVSLFREMERSGIHPDNVTYLNVLSACGHSGLIGDGLVIFNQMVEEKRIAPSGEHCGCVVDLLARAGRLSDASIFMNTISGKVGPNAWRALLGGCWMHSDVRLAELAASRLLELEPEDTDCLVVLSNVYASVGRYKEAEALRSSMIMKRSQKSPGMSLLSGLLDDFG